MALSRKLVKLPPSNALCCNQTLVCQRTLKTGTSKAHGKGPLIYYKLGNVQSKEIRRQFGECRRTRVKRRMLQVPAFECRNNIGELGVRYVLPRPLARFFPLPKHVSHRPAGSVCGPPAGR